MCVAKEVQRVFATCVSCIVVSSGGSTAACLTTKYSSSMHARWHSRLLHDHFAGGRLPGTHSPGRPAAGTRSVFEGILLLSSFEAVCFGL